ncbi:MAG TPA: hypothetical protein VH352_25745 [Pseudonocardiaceae bacterium]|nr:hypothetical protein [Pseudonocardiaceae bacterium]
MAKIVLQLLSANGTSLAHPHVLALASTGQSPSSYVVVAIAAAVAVFIALVRLLKRILVAMVANLFKSAVIVLATLTGTGALLLTTVLTVMTRR